MESNFLPFPKDFAWGAATAAYQIEGAVTADGRGDSIWDVFCRKPGLVKNGDTGKDACRHYEHWKSDIAMMKTLGLKAYRFSVAWPRIVPQGRGPLNSAGLDFYERLVDELLQAGIAPNCTLYHWDLPQELESKGGWANRDTAYAYAEYVAMVAKRLGNRVPMWATFNEPQCSAYLGYASGIHAPGRKENEATVNQVVHHLLLAHGLGIRELRLHAPQSKAGIVYVPSAIWPYPGRKEDVDAAERDWKIANDWWVLPLLQGKYPEAVWALKGDSVPKIVDGDMEIISSPIDYLGLNYYARSRVTHDPAQTKGSLEAVQAPAPEGAEFQDMPGWEIFPAGLENLLVQFTERYGKIPLYVTENGMSRATDAPGMDGKIHDEKRIRFLRDHFIHAWRAMQRGVDLRGYYVWALMDNFEWALGYTQRFGLVHVDYGNFQRTPKDSFEWYREVIRQSGLQDPGLPQNRSPFEMASSL